MDRQEKGKTVQFAGSSDAIRKHAHLEVRHVPADDRDRLDVCLATRVIEETCEVSWETAQGSTEVSEIREAGAALSGGHEPRLEASIASVCLKRGSSSGPSRLYMYDSDGNLTLPSLSPRSAG